MTNPTFRHAFASRTIDPLFFVGSIIGSLVFPADADAPNWDGWSPLLNWDDVTVGNLNTIQTEAESAGKMISLEVCGTNHPNAAAFSSSPDFAATDWWDDYETMLNVVATNLGDSENFVEFVTPSFGNQPVPEPFNFSISEVTSLEAGAPWYSQAVVEGFAHRAAEIAQEILGSDVVVRVNIDPLSRSDTDDEVVPEIDRLIASSIRLGTYSVYATAGETRQAALGLLTQVKNRNRIDGFAATPSRLLPSFAGDAVTRIQACLDAGADQVILGTDGAATLWTDAAVVAAFGS